MTRERRLIVLLLSLLAVLVLAVAACGGGEGDAAQSDEAAAETGGAEAEEPAASSEPVTLEVWNNRKGDPTWEKVIEQLDAEFMADHPNIMIKQTFQPDDGIDLKFKAAVAAGDVPDVLMSTDTIDWKALRPLDDLLTDDQKNELTLIETQRSPFDKKLHFVPFGSYGEVLLMNRAVWEQAGLDPDNPPTTWDELMSACDAFNEQGIMPIAYAFKDPWTAIRMYAWIGGQLFSIEDTFQQWRLAQIPWDDARAQQALDDFVSAVQEHRCFGDKPETKLSTDVYNEFLSGRAALTLVAQAYNTPLTEVEEKIGEGNLDFMALPLTDGAVYDEPTVDGGYNNLLSITCRSTNVEAAWEYISFYLDEHAQEVSFEATNQYPNNVNADVSVAQTELDAAVAEELLNPDVHYGLWPTGTREGEVFNRDAPLFLSGRMSREDFVAKLADARKEAREQAERDIRRAEAAC